MAVPKSKKETENRAERELGSAEQLFKKNAAHIKTIPAEDIRDLVHELRVHQIEMELRNEESHRAQRAPEDPPTEYYQRYEFAPVGYFTFDQENAIRAVNLAGAKLLGIERNFLIGTPFANYVLKDSGKEFYNHLEQVFQTHTKQVCELQLQAHDGTHFFVTMESVAFSDQDGNFSRCFSAISEMNQRKQFDKMFTTADDELKQAIPNRPTELGKSDAEPLAEVEEPEEFEVSEARYRALFMNTPISIWEEDFTAVGEWLEELRAGGVRDLQEYLKAEPDALKSALERIRILKVNQATLDLLEAESKEELMSRFHALFTDETYLALTQELLAIWEGRTRLQIEVTGVTLKGNRIDCILHWFALKKDGRLDLSNVIIAFADFTERKRVEEEKELLLASSQAIHQATDFQSAVGIALDEICESTRWDYGEVWLPGGTDNKVITYSSSWCVDSPALRQFAQLSGRLSLAKGEGLPGRVWASGKAEWVVDVSASPDEMVKRSQPASEVGLKTALGVPIVDNRVVLAVLVFFGYDKRSADERMIGLISTVAAQLGTLLQRKKAEAALSESEARYRGLVESSPDAIVVAQDGQVVFMNSAATRLLGCSATEFEGLDFLELFHEDAKPSLEKLFKQKENAPATLVEAAVRHKNGKLIEVEVAVIHTLYQGSPGILALLRNVTEKKALQRKQTRLERLSTLGQISGNIAHEIRNPLGTIQLNCAYLERHSNIDAKAQERFDDLKHSIRRIESIIDSVLGFARPAQPKKTEVDLHAILNASLDLVKDDLKAAGTRVVKRYNATQTQVAVDINQMLQVFVNLFTNAREAMQEQGQLTIETLAHKNQIHVQVIDNGQGIEPEELDKIFEPFFTSKSAGTGLGMAIVEQILEKHRVSISVQSDVGEGTTVTLRFPLVKRSGSGESV